MKRDAFRHSHFILRSLALFEWDLLKKLKSFLIGEQGLVSSVDITHTGTHSHGRHISDKKLSQMVDVYGGGELVALMRDAIRSADHSFVNAFILNQVKPLMYKSGNGKLVAKSELIRIRNKQRNAKLNMLQRKEGKGKHEPNVLDNVDQEGNRADLHKVLKLLDAGGMTKSGESKYRLVVWRMEERGAAGESLLGACLMRATSVHNAVARKLVTAFPKCVNDVFISEDYYGFSPLHQAIVNEDPSMVYFLLKHGANVNQRCFGAFFCAEDQRSRREDSLEEEAVQLCLETNYVGRSYFGEYPLSFAVSCAQPDCFRLLCRYGCNVNAQDSNGNTVLHMAVIHDQPELLRLAFESGAKLSITNKLKLTPLTLAAKLAKREMLYEILDLESDVLWVHRETRCSSYPLANIDSISEINGEVNDLSALSLAVYGTSGEHLELLDGLLVDLLQAKWVGFARKKLAISFVSYAAYFAAICFAFFFRPVTQTTKVLTNGAISVLPDGFEAIPVAGYFHPKRNDSDLARKAGPYEPLVSCSIADFFMNPFQVYTTDSRCHLLWYRVSIDPDQWVRFILEGFAWIAAVVQLVDDVRVARSLKDNQFIGVISAFPAKLVYKFSFLCVLAIPLVRSLCFVSELFLHLDNWLSVFALLSAAFHTLFYARSLKFVGPFVVVMMKMIAHDMVRFLLIYGVFIVGFSQGFYIVFSGCRRVGDITPRRMDMECDDLNSPTDTFHMNNSIEPILRLFIMTLGESMTVYRELNSCKLQSSKLAGKILFLIYQLFVSILMINLLIAMFTRTYQAVSQTQKEWLRQWAKVILMLEMSMRAEERHLALLRYSLPIGTDKSRRAFVVVQKTEVKPNAERSTSRAKEHERRKI